MVRTPGDIWALLFIPVFYSFYPRQENRSFLLQPRDRTITENGHSGTAWTGMSRTGIIRKIITLRFIYTCLFSSIQHN